MTEAKEEKNSGKATGECTELQETVREPEQPQGTPGAGTLGSGLVCAPRPRLSHPCILQDGGGLENEPLVAPGNGFPSPGQRHRGASEDPHCLHHTDTPRSLS